MLHTLITIILALIALHAPPAPSPQAPEKPAAAAATPIASPIHKDWTIDNTKREGLIYAPKTATTQPTPVVFGFHGHGGNSRNAARSFRMHEEWPEAIVVYLQGLPTPGAITDPKGERNGWQKDLGDQNDRDLKFFDAVLADLKKTYTVDEARIYSTGHSNGGAFTYLLWAERPDVFAAVAPCAAGGNLRIMSVLKPKPVMHIAGTKDPLVKFDYQKRIMDRDRKVDGCEPEGKEWGGNKDCTIYSSKADTPVVTMIHDGTHTYPKQAPPLIVKFFKEHTKPAESKSNDPARPNAAKPEKPAETGAPSPR